MAGPVNHPELVATELIEEELMVVTAPWFLDLDRMFSAISADKLKIIMFREGCAYRARLENLLATRGIVGVRRLDFGTLEGILGCVGAGIGLTLLPRAVVETAARERPRCYSPASIGRSIRAYCPDTPSGCVRVHGPPALHRNGKRASGGAKRRALAQSCHAGARSSRTNISVGCPLYDVALSSRYPHFIAIRIEAAFSGAIMQKVRAEEKCESPQATAARTASVA